VQNLRKGESKKRPELAASEFKSSARQKQGGGGGGRGVGFVGGRGGGVKHLRGSGSGPERGEAEASQRMRLQTLHSCSPRLGVEGGDDRVGDVVWVRLLASAHAGHQRRSECPLHLQYKIMAIDTQHYT